eukprot:145156-Pyramimonas_sp.AAC.1
MHWGGRQYNSINVASCLEARTSKTSATMRTLGYASHEYINLLRKVNAMASTRPVPSEVEPEPSATAMDALGDEGSAELDADAEDIVGALAGGGAEDIVVQEEQD